MTDEKYERPKAILDHENAMREAAADMCHIYSTIAQAHAAMSLIPMPMEEYRSATHSVGSNAHLQGQQLGRVRDSLAAALEPLREAITYVKDAFLVARIDEPSRRKVERVAARIADMFSPPKRPDSDN